MHGRPALALLLVLPLFAPTGASGAAVPRDRQIRKVEAITTSAGALVRVTLRAELKGRLRVGFERSDGKSGSTRRSRSSAAAGAPTSCSRATPAT